MAHSRDRKSVSVKYVKGHWATPLRSSQLSRSLPTASPASGYLTKPLLWGLGARAHLPAVTFKTQSTGKHYLPIAGEGFSDGRFSSTFHRRALLSTLGSGLPVMRSRNSEPLLPF